jgi:predicted nucleic acid-binding Zn ribbon protein
VSSEPRPLSESMDRLLASLKGGDRATTVSVFSRWAELVGDQVAAHCRPLKLDEGVLVVEVDDPAWATQLKILHSDVIDRLQAGGGMAVERLEITVARRR